MNVQLNKYVYRLYTTSLLTAPVLRSTTGGDSRQILNYFFGVSVVNDVIKDCKKKKERVNQVEILDYSLTRKTNASILLDKLCAQNKYSIIFSDGVEAFQLDGAFSPAACYFAAPCTTG